MLVSLPFPHQHSNSRAKGHSPLPPFPHLLYLWAIGPAGAVHVYLLKPWQGDAHGADRGLQYLDQRAAPGACHHHQSRQDAPHRQPVVCILPSLACLYGRERERESRKKRVRLQAQLYLNQQIGLSTQVVRVCLTTFSVSLLLPRVDDIEDDSVLRRGEPGENNKREAVSTSKRRSRFLFLFAAFVCGFMCGRFPPQGSQPISLGCSCDKAEKR